MNAKSETLDLGQASQVDPQDSSAQHDWSGPDAHLSFRGMVILTSLVICSVIWTSSLFVLIS